MTSISSAETEGQQTAATELHLTRVQVLILVGKVLVLVNPLPVAFEEDLQRGRRSAAQLDGVAFDDVGVLRLLDEVRQGALRRRRAVGLNVPRGSCKAKPRLLRRLFVAQL